MSVPTNVPGTLTNIIRLAKSHRRSYPAYTVGHTRNIQHQEPQDEVDPCPHSKDLWIKVRTSRAMTRSTSNSRPLPSTIGQLKTEETQLSTSFGQPNDDTSTDQEKPPPPPQRQLQSRFQALTRNRTNTGELQETSIQQKQKNNVGSLTSAA